MQLRRAEARAQQLVDLVLLLRDLLLADLVLEDLRRGVDLAPEFSLQGGVVGQVHLGRERKLTPRSFDVLSKVSPPTFTPAGGGPSPR